MMKLKVYSYKHYDIRARWSSGWEKKISFIYLMRYVLIKNVNKRMIFVKYSPSSSSSEKKHGLLYPMHES